MSFVPDWEVVDAMVRLYEALDEHERELWVDSRVVGLTYTELGDREGVSHQAVGQRLQKIEDKLDAFDRELAEAAAPAPRAPRPKAKPKAAFRPAAPAVRSRHGCDVQGCTAEMSEPGLCAWHRANGTPDQYTSEAA